MGRARHPLRTLRLRDYHAGVPPERGRRRGGLPGLFARLFEHLDRVRDDAAIRGWIAQTARRLSVDRLRAAARERVGLDELEPSDVDEKMATLDEALAVREALATLPEHCREILDRFFARDEGYDTIGVALGIPAGTIASRISRCLEKLRAAFVGRRSDPHPSIYG
jgi:RNA polymerase sigma factor (sigma-70 family)